jgi:hypothetical protein
MEASLARENIHNQGSESVHHDGITRTRTDHADHVPGM